MASACVAISAFAWCQENPGNIGDLSDALMSVADDDTRYASLLEVVSTEHFNVIDLNRATPDELRILNMLTDAQIDSFLEWRRLQGPLLDIHELQVIPGFDVALIQRLLPYVVVIDPATRLDHRFLRRMTATENSHVVVRYQRTLEKQKGFRRGDGRGFIGSRDALYLRMRSSLPGSFSFGLTCEKDAGEQMRWDLRDSPLGFDFTSFHFQVQNKRWLRNLIVGDFRFQFAQGLLLGGGIPIGRGGDGVSGLQKASTGFSPYTSLQESAYLRGIALTIKVRSNIAASFFFSRTMRDAAVDEDSSVVHTVYSTGLHRTVTELASRRKLREHAAGMVIRLTSRNLDAGMIGTSTHFGGTMQRRITPYNQFAFRGYRSINAGLFLNYRHQNFSFFSEAATSIGTGHGVVAGVLFAAHRNLDVATIYRYYSPDFHTFNSNALSENSQPQNEEGLHWAWQYRWNRRCSFSGYVDVFRFPWLGFRRYAPSAGYEWSLRGTYRPTRDVRVLLQLRQELKPRNSPQVSKVYKLADCVKRHLLLNVEYNATRHIRMKSRIQHNSQHFEKATTVGWAFVQDISVDVGKFTFAGRHALFDTDHYDNRHYVYERDTWSSFAMPAYAGVGVRNYVLIEYKAAKSLTLWIRFARTRMLSGEEIGSGEDTINGNTRNDVKLQARLTF